MGATYLFYIFELLRFRKKREGVALKWDLSPLSQSAHPQIFAKSDKNPHTGVYCRVLEYLLEIFFLDHAGHFPHFLDRIIGHTWPLVSFF